MCMHMYSMILLTTRQYYTSAQGLKNHAVTMFEVGKLTDESMDSFLVELGKVYNYALLLYIYLLFIFDSIM